jgi:polyphosphate kinase
MGSWLAPRRLSVTDEARLFNRELSWLDYDARVLARAADPGLPALERSRNCAYFSSNLDEFFQVRVAGLMGQEESGLLVRSPDGRTPSRPWRRSARRPSSSRPPRAKLWKRDLRPALEEGRDHRRRRRRREQEGARGARGPLRHRHLPDPDAPLAVGPGQPFPYISPLSLSLGIFVRDPETGDERFARVKVPELLPRFPRDRRPRACSCRSSA